MNQAETIKQMLMKEPFYYEEVTLLEEDVQDDFVGYQFDVVSPKYGAYEISVFSHDQCTFEVRKESDEGFGDLEGGFQLHEPI